MSTSTCRWVWFFALATLLFANRASSQQDARRTSPLVQYRGVQQVEAAPDAKQVYRSLLDVPRVATAVPIDRRTVVSVASRVGAVADDRFQLLPKQWHAIGDNKWAVQYIPGRDAAPDAVGQ